MREEGRRMEVKPRLRTKGRYFFARAFLNKALTRSR